MKSINFIGVFVIILFFQTPTVSQELEDVTKKQTGFIIQMGGLFATEKITYPNEEASIGALKLDAIYGFRSTKNNNIFVGVGLGYRRYYNPTISGWTPPHPNPSLPNNWHSRINFSIPTKENILSILTVAKFDFPIDFPVPQKSSLYISPAFGYSFNLNDEYDKSKGIGILLNISAGIGINKIQIGPAFELQGVGGALYLWGGNLIITL